MGHLLVVAQRHGGTRARVIALFRLFVVLTSRVAVFVCDFLLIELRTPRHANQSIMNDFDMHV